MLSRRAFMKQSAAGTTAALAAAFTRSSARAEGQRPNIVWIYSDDHAQKAVSAYGGPLSGVAPTPNIDRIAQNGMVFRNSFVTNSLCGPCRAVILTGLHSHLNGFRQNGDRFDGGQQTFPKLLQQAGYQTAVYGKWHLETDPTGFDAWEILPGQGCYYNPDFQSAQGTKRETGYVTDIIADKALDWMQHRRDPQKPFMIMIQHKAPHREWEPGPDHLNDFNDVEIPEPPTLFDDYAGRGTAAREQDMSIEKTMRVTSDLKVWGDEIPKEDMGSWKRTYGRMTEEQRAAWDAAYARRKEEYASGTLEGKALVRWKYQQYMKDYLRCIRSVDDNVGRVLDYLEKTGLDKNTVVFYSSDQSFYLGEHGWFDKRFIYEESFRTPLVAQWPGVIQPGSSTGNLVQNLDMAETFLAIAGVPVPKTMQGLSLVPLMKGEQPADWRTSLYYQYFEGEGKVHNVYKHYGVRNDRYKLAHFHTLGEWEFYDLEKDPQEMKNQYGNPDYADQVAALKAELARLREQYRVPAEVNAK